MIIPLIPADKVSHLVKALCIFSTNCHSMCFAFNGMVMAVSQFPEDTFIEGIGKMRLPAKPYPYLQECLLYQRFKQSLLNPLVGTDDKTGCPPQVIKRGIR